MSKSRKRHSGGNPKAKSAAAKSAATKTGGVSWWAVSIAGLVAVAIALVGYGIWSQPSSPENADIPGVANYAAEPAGWFDDRDHKKGVLEYDTTPPAGGNHNSTWQRCDGVVYDAPIPSEHAVHSLEHGAVWITYEPGLDDAQLTKLKKKVEGRDYTFMSPYAKQDSPIALQAWGYQLKVDKADDERIDEFLATYRVEASQEPGATCSGGVTATGDTPSDQQNGM